MPRNQDHEHAFLRDATRGRADFIDLVEQRLAAGDDTYGDSYQWVGLRKLLDELLEEARDLAAWAALADETLDSDRELSDLHRQQIRAVLTTAARSGAFAHDALMLARRSLQERPR